MPESGEWAGNIVVCDRYKGNKIRGLPPFYGLESNGQTFAQVVNDYKKMVGDGVNVYNMAIPLSSAYYEPPNMKGTFTDQHWAINVVGKKLKNVTLVDLYDNLGSHLDEYIYSRTDHHWQPLGAYYAVKQFAEIAGVDFAPLSTYKKCVKQDYLGSLYMYSGNLQELADHPDTFTYYKPANSYSTKYYDGYFSNGQSGDLFFDWVSGSGCYLAFLGTDTNICEIKTDVKNGRTLVLIKDSYGNALVPFLVGSFEKIYVVDFRYTYIKMQDFFQKVGATDVLFGMSITSNYNPSHVDLMRALRA